ncbi:MAG: cysteine hydrolase family protein [Ignavibacteriaceae bacterium]|nr:cysteine hydrolase family protein [Ignavibacteriaceae bacterium]
MIYKFLPLQSVAVPELKFENKVSLDSDSTALIIVDMQNDFVREDGSLFVPAAKETIGNIHNLLSEARKQNVKVVYTQDTHLDGDKEWEIWPRHCKKVHPAGKLLMS